MHDYFVMGKSWLMRIFIVVAFFLLPVLGLGQGYDEIKHSTRFVEDVLASDGCRWKDDRLDSVFELLLNSRTDGLSPRQRKLVAQDYVGIARSLEKWDSPEAALLFFSQALKFDPSNTDAILLRSRLYFSLKDYDRTYRDLVMVYPRISSGQYYRAVTLSHLVSNKFDSIIEERYRDGELAVALGYAQRLDTLMMLYPQGSDGYNGLMSRILLDVEQQYFNKIDYLCHSGQHDSALFYIGKVTGMLSQYAWYMDSTEIIQQRKHIKDLLLSCVKEGENEQDIALISNVINNFTALCEIFSDRVCSLVIDSLRNNAYQLNFSILQGKLRHAIQAGDFEEGIRYVKMIDEFVNEYPVDNTREYYTLRDSLLRLYAAHRIKRVYNLMDRGRFEQARSLLGDLAGDSFLKKYVNDTLSTVYRQLDYREIIYLLSLAPGNDSLLPGVEKMILRNNLYNDSLVMSRLYAVLSHKGQACVQKHKNFFSTMSQIGINLMSRDYLLAHRKLTQLLKQGYGLCPLPVDTITALLNEISPLVAFQMLYNDMLDSYRNHDYQGSFDAMMALVGFYRDKRLGQYGQQAPDLYQLSTSFNNSFINLAISRLIKIDSLSLAFKLLKYLHSQSVPARYTRDVQKELGYRMAIRDFSLDPYQKPRKAIKKYCKDDPLWYRYFLLSYYRQRSRMKAFQF